MAADILEHVDGWFTIKRNATRQLLRAVAGEQITDDDLDLVRDLLAGACARTDV